MVSSSASLALSSCSCSSTTPLIHTASALAFSLRDVCTSACSTSFADKLFSIFRSNSWGNNRERYGLVRGVHQFRTYEEHTTFIIQNLWRTHKDKPAQLTSSSCIWWLLLLRAAKAWALSSLPNCILSLFLSISARSFSCKGFQVLFKHGSNKLLKAGEMYQQHL